MSKTLRCKLKIRQTLGSDARADTVQLSDLNWLKIQPIDTARVTQVTGPRHWGY